MERESSCSLSIQNKITYRYAKHTLSPPLPTWFQILLALPGLTGSHFDVEMAAPTITGEGLEV